MPKATFFVFSFILSYFHLFTMNVTRALSLEAIKGGQGPHLGTLKKQHTRTSPEQNTRTSPSKETWDPLPLSKACNPYYEHSGARQQEQQQNPLDVGSFMPRPIYTLVSALHTIWA
jgi:hypothetical protein